MTDQQNHHMMGAAGNPYLQILNMDWLAEEGVMFIKLLLGKWIELSDDGFKLK